MIIKKEVFSICFIGIFLIAIFANIALAASSLSIDNALIKFSVKEGDYATKPFTIKSEWSSAVNIRVLNLNMVSLSEDAPLMNAGDSRTIFVLVNSSGTNPGAYVGYVSINSIDSEVKMPVIVEIESKDIFFDSNIEIPSLYADIAPGENVVAQIKMFDLTDGVEGGLSPSSVSAEYSVYNNKGDLIVSETESLVINKNSGITKSLKIPENAAEGNYFISVVLKHGSSVGVSSAMFSVSSSGLGGGTKFGNFSFTWITTLVGIIIILGLFMFLFFLLVKDRDKFMISLKRYHNSEMKKQKEYLAEQKCIIEKKKCVSPRLLKAEVKNKIANLRIKQKMRMKELSKLKELGDEAAMERKLKEWKSKGYDTLMLESRLSNLTGAEMKKIMVRWKRNGYLLR